MKEMRIYTQERVSQMSASERAQKAGIIQTSGTLSPEEKRLNLKMLYPSDRRLAILADIQAGAADIDDMNRD